MNSIERQPIHKLILNNREITEKDYADFIVTLENDYKNFKDKLKKKKNEKMFENLNSNKENRFIKINFCPEDIVSKSPLTILDAHWGSGKTYFLNNYINTFC